MVTIKKESPNEGTETISYEIVDKYEKRIKKESPNEGTETLGDFPHYKVNNFLIKKESPNEGTETRQNV